MKYEIGKKKKTVWKIWFKCFIMVITSSELIYYSIKQQNIIITTEKYANVHTHTHIYIYIYIYCITS